MRLPRFRIRTLMIVVAMIAVACAWPDSPRAYWILVDGYYLGCPVIGALIDRRRGRSGILGGGFGGMAAPLVSQLVAVIFGHPGAADPVRWASSIAEAAIGFAIGIPIGWVVCVIGKLLSRRHGGDREEKLDLPSPPAE